MILNDLPNTRWRHILLLRLNKSKHTLICIPLLIQLSPSHRFLIKNPLPLGKHPLPGITGKPGGEERSLASVPMAYRAEDALASSLLLLLLLLLLFSFFSSPDRLISPHLTKYHGGGVSPETATTGGWGGGRAPYSNGEGRLRHLRWCKNLKIQL
jgi:hypothetical protein